MLVQPNINDLILHGNSSQASEIGVYVHEGVEEYKQERILVNCSDITINKVSAIGAYEDLVSYRVKTFSPDSAGSSADVSQGQCAIDLNKIIPMPDKLVFDHEYLACALDRYCLPENSAFFNAMGPEWRKQAQAIGDEYEVAKYVVENPDSDFTVAAIMLLNNAESEVKAEALKYWKLENWDSPSNSHHRECGPIVPLGDGSGQFSLTCMFDNADWSHPGPVFDQLISDWPTLDFRFVVASDDSDVGLCLISKKGVMSQPSCLDDMEIRIQEFGCAPDPDNPYRLIHNYRKDEMLVSPYKPELGTEGWIAYRQWEQQCWSA